jgi:hypothetical protein
MVRSANSLDSFLQLPVTGRKLGTREFLGNGSVGSKVRNSLQDLLSEIIDLGCKVGYITRGIKMGDDGQL